MTTTQTETLPPITELESMLAQAERNGLEDIADRIHTLLCEKMGQETEAGNIPNFTQGDINKIYQEYGVECQNKD